MHGTNVKIKQPDLCSKDGRFVSQLGHRVSPLRQKPGQYCQVGHNHFLPHPSRFLTHCHAVIRYCEQLTSSVNYRGFLFPVDILLKATGNAPIMKKKKWAVDPDKKIGWIMEFIKKYLKLDRSEQLVIFKIRNQTTSGMRNRPLSTQLSYAC